MDRLIFLTKISAFRSFKTIFDNNPHVDEYVDKIDGEVFHDHYKINNNTNTTVPLIEQILKFWQFDNFDNIEPELYFTDKEIKLAKQIIKEHCDGKFGTLLISNRYKGEGKELIQQKLDEYN